MDKPAHLLMLVAATSSEGEDSSVCEAFLPRDISRRGAVVGMAWAGRKFRLLRGVRRLGSAKGAGIPGLRNAHVASAPRVWQWLGPHPYRGCGVSGRVRRSLDRKSVV